MSFLGGQFDERFLMHRLRSTSIASMAGAVLAAGLFLYHGWVEHLWRWDLFAILLTMAVIKQGLMAWYRFKN